MESWKRFADYDKVFGNPRPGMVFAPQALRTIVANTKGAVLDIGTGHGYKLCRILKESRAKVTKVVALEPSPLSWRASKEIACCCPEAEVLARPLEEFSTRQRFDTVLTFEVLEHIPLQERDAFMERIKSLLAPGGTLILSTPNRGVYRMKCWLARSHPDPTHIREFSYQELRAFLARYFRALTFFGSFPYMGLFRRFPRLTRLNPFAPVRLSHCIYVIAQI